MWKFDPLDLLSFAMRLEGFLSAHEKQRLERFADPTARREFIICRGVLHILLSVLSGESDSALQISEGGREKPHLDIDGHTHPLAFNISHTDGLCLIACGREVELGVDVERIQPLPELAAMANTYLSPQELDIWVAVDANQQIELFYRYWSAKEALLKAVGCGLSIPPNRVNTLDVLAGKTVCGQQDDGFFFEIEACILEALPLEPACAAWLAIFGQPENVYLFDLDAKWVETAIFSMGRNVEK